jgi:glycolate oxidase iron-sulfur subunit
LTHRSSSLGEGPDAAGEPGAQHVAALDLPTAVGAPSRGSLAATLQSEQDKLLTCVHCGFCLPACPTYTRLGDENDSPRGRLHLMRGVAEGRLDPASNAFQIHIDRCLGCRACETVCPSGVQYGALLELAREEVVRASGGRWRDRLLLALFSRPGATRVVMALARVLRATGLPALVAWMLPAWGWLAGPRLAAGMLAASAPWRGLRRADRAPAAGGGDGEATADGAALARARGGDSGRPVGEAGVTGLLRGCVQQGLFSHVNDATARVLSANGLQVHEVPEQVCCGALHAHAGDLEGARALARRNVDAFGTAGVNTVVVNAAGCGAVMKEYGHLLEHDRAYAERAATLAAAVRDLSEVLAERGPRPGAPVGLTVTADAPCHQLHAQGVAIAPGMVLDAIPGLRVVPLAGADECCGGAGLYGMTHPDLGGRIGADKVAAVTATGADAVVTGNPGCIMQIGAGLRMARTRTRALHPVELLDESYRRAGRYGTAP